MKKIFALLLIALLVASVPVFAAQDDSIFVYECSGYGALVKFSVITGKGRYVVSWKGGKHEGEC